MELDFSAMDALEEPSRFLLLLHLYGELRAYYQHVWEYVLEHIDPQAAQSLQEMRALLHRIEALLLEYMVPPAGAERN